MFDNDGYFDREVSATRDPLASKRLGHDVFIQPSLSTELAPELKEGKWPRFIEGSWVQIDLPKTIDELVNFGPIKHDSTNVFWRQINSLRNSLLANEKYVKQDLKDGHWYLERIPEPTAEELLEQRKQEARSKRDYLISQTDYLLTPDYPISDEDLKLVKAYRTALRDLPAQEGFPDSINWPEPPAFLTQMGKERRS